MISRCNKEKVRPGRYCGAKVGKTEICVSGYQFPVSSFQDLNSGLAIKYYSSQFPGFMCSLPVAMRHSEIRTPVTGNW